MPTDAPVALQADRQATGDTARRGRHTIRKHQDRCASSGGGMEHNIVRAWRRLHDYTSFAITRQQHCVRLRMPVTYGTQGGKTGEANPLLLLP